MTTIFGFQPEQLYGHLIETQIIAAGTSEEIKSRRVYGIIINPELIDCLDSENSQVFDSDYLWAFWKTNETDAINSYQSARVVATRGKNLFDLELITAMPDEEQHKYDLDRLVQALQEQSISHIHIKFIQTLKIIT